MPDQNTRSENPGLIPNDGTLAESLRKRMSLAGRRVVSEELEEDDGRSNRFVFSLGQLEVAEPVTSRADGNVVIKEVAVPPPDDVAASLDGYKSLMLLTQILVIMLAIQAGYFVATLMAEYAHVAPGLASTSHWGPFEMLLFPLTAAAFLVWTYRLYDNLEAFGTAGLSTKPVIAAALVAIPVVNLITPPIIFQEVWCATNPRIDCRVDEAWRKSGADGLIPVWWLTFMAALCLRIMTNLLVAWSGRPSVTIACYVAFAVSAVLGIASIWRMSVRQDDKQLLLLAGVDEA